MTNEAHTEHPASHTMACGVGVGYRPEVVTLRGGGSIPLVRPEAGMECWLSNRSHTPADVRSIRTPATMSTPNGAMVYSVSTGPCHGPEAGSIPASPADRTALDTKVELFA